MKQVIRFSFGALRAVIAIGLLVYLGVSGGINWGALRSLTKAWPLLVVALVVASIAVVLTAWRLCVLMKPRGLHLSLPSSIRLSLIGMFFNTCLLGSAGGDVVKIYYAVEGNGRKTEVATVILLDRAVGMLAMILSPLLLIPFFPGFVTAFPFLVTLLVAAAVVAAIMIAGMMLSFSQRVRHNRLVATFFKKLPLGMQLETVFHTLHLYRNNKAVLLLTAIISLLAHTLTIGMALIIALAIDPAHFTWTISILIPLGFLANTLPLTPGGLGVGEAAFDRLFSLVGLAHGAEVILGTRMILLLISLSGFIFYLQGRKPSVHHHAASAQKSKDDFRLEPLYSAER